jgi:CheY-like chemotaxis protein/signal transduction histidine kinase/HPt (histidine-containing phosphotransfer) domain-containing protein
LRRKLLFINLFAVILSVAAVTLFVSFEADLAVNELVDEHRVSVESQLQDKIVSFDYTMLVLAEKMEMKAEQSLLDIEGNLKRLRKTGREPDIELLQQWSAEQGVDSVYLINRNGVVYRSSDSREVGFNLMKTGRAYSDFLKKQYGSGKFSHGRMTVGIISGKLTMFSYYSPAGEDYIIEVSQLYSDFVTRNYGEDVYRYIFHDYFQNISASSKYVESVDIYTRYKVSGRSFFNPDKSFDLDMSYINKLKNGEKVTFRHGNRLYEYSSFNLSNLKSGFDEHYYLEVVYNFGSAGLFLMRSLLSVLGIMTFLGIFFFMLMNRFFNVYLLNRLYAINDSLDKVADGDYTLVMPLKYNDELDSIASHVMRLALEIEEREKTLKNESDLMTHYRQEAEKANFAKSEFMTLAGSELKIPLGGLASLADTLRKTPLEDNQKQYLDMIDHSISHMLRLVESMDDLNKSESGRLFLDKNVFSMSETVKDITASFDRLLETKRKRLELSLTQGLPDKVTGDPYRLRQALGNIIRCAADNCTGDVIYFSYFFKENGSDKLNLSFVTEYTGTAPQLEFGAESGSALRLGISAASRIAELMGGGLTVENSASSVRIVFSSAFEPVSGEKVVIEEKTGKLKILLVDDSEYNRYVVESYLENTGAVLDYARSGSEALEMFVKNRYDLLLMDIQMPVMDGYSVTREIRSLEKDGSMKRVPVIAITAYTPEREARRCLEAGCDAYVAKPLSRNALLSTISSLIPAFSSFAESEVVENMVTEAEGIIYVNVRPDFREITPRFLTSIRENLETVRKALEENDYETIKIIGHRLKGEAKTFGFEPVSDFGLFIQGAAIRKNREKVEETLQKLDDYLKKIRLVFSDNTGD